MNIPVSCEQAFISPLGSSDAADSSVRQLVVPTEMTRPPRSLQAFILSAVSCGKIKKFLMKRVEVVWIAALALFYQRINRKSITSCHEAI